MKRTFLFLIAFLMPICVLIAKDTYTYKLVITNVDISESKQYVYPKINNYYSFKVERTPTVSNGFDFAKGIFNIKLENAKFSDGNIERSVYENSTFFVIEFI
jgi:hypothetical protein